MTTITDFNKLIPELQNWNNGNGIDIYSWIGCVGDFQKAIGYSVIFWPEFIEIDGGVFRKMVLPENIAKWKDSQKCDTKTIEATVNHIHLKDLHCYECSDATPERLEFLGNTLKQIYECKLKHDFPEKNFTVEFYRPEKDKNDLLEYILTFYQTN